MRRHTYSADNDYRVKVTAALGILAYLLGTWLANVLGYLTTALPQLLGVADPVLGVVEFLWSPLSQLGLRPEVWVPATGLLFAVLFAAFNRWWWRHRWIQATPFVTAPDLNGEWTVHVQQTESSLASDGGNKSETELDRPEVNTQVIGTAFIDQTWRRMLISMEFEDSISISLGGSIITDTHPTRLNYYYRNEPKPSAPEEADVHYGTADLRYDEDADVLEGEYFTDRFRQTSGEIILKQESTNGGD